jgi:glycosyltransferase involved in cell wall biosynthesis
VETARFTPGPVGNDYVVLSELMPHKRIDLAIEAFNELDLPLTVIGNGPDARRLRRLAGPKIQFTGRVSDAEAAVLLSAARALVVTATEEFGIAAVEAQAAGRPVIALREGGVRETVVEGETGVFFDRPEPAALVAAVRSLDPLAVDPAACVSNAERFDVSHFRHGLRALVDRALEAERPPRPRPRRARGLALSQS